MNMKAVLFCRVSSKEQEDTGYSLPSQEKLLTEYCQTRGFEIGKIFSLSESAGGSKQRKIFLEMLEYLKKNKLKILIVEKTDRLTRNMRDAVTVNGWIEDDDEKQVYFVKENFILNRNSKSNDKFIWGIKVTTAQYYLDNLSEEVKKGQKEKIRQGGFPSKAPYGYKTIGDKGRKVHVVDENIGPLIKKMFVMYASGDYSLQKLAVDMYNLGLRSSAGRMIHKSRIHRLLTDPFYIGKMLWKGVEYQATHEPLIDLEIFEKVGKKLTSRTTPKYSKHNFLFKGLIKCERCGCNVTWEVHKGINYGHCTNGAKCGTKKWSKEKDIEIELVEKLTHFKITNQRLLGWLTKALKETNQTESGFYLNSIAELEKQRTVMKKRLDAIYIDKIDGKITQVYYDEKFREFTKEMELLDQQISKHTSATSLGQNKRITLFELAQGKKEYYLNGDVSKRREIIRDVFSVLRINEEKLVYTLNDDYALLKERISDTNSSKLGKLMDSGDKIFEQYDLTKASKHYAISEPQCSIVLPLEDSNLGPIA